MVLNEVFLSRLIKLFTHASEYICPKNKTTVISITLINLVNLYQTNQSREEDLD